MKTYLVLLNDKSKETLDETLLAEHIKHLKRLNEKGYLITCGPFADDSGAMLLIQADTEVAVTLLIQADPFIKQSYYLSYKIIEFYKADEANNYLMTHEQTLEELNRE